LYSYVLLYGLRRVGKSTVLYQLIDSLLQGGTNSDKILYFSFDEQSANLSSLLSLYEERVLKTRLAESGPVYLFLDEIQKCKDWQNQLKILYDLHPKLKIFLSGSASVSLQKHSTESLAGRLVEIFVKPLSFSEFLQWKGVVFDAKRPTLASAEIKAQLMDYWRKGGFPEIVGEQEDERIRQYVRSTILERIIFRDIPQEFGVHDTSLLRTLLETFIQAPGMVVNTDRLSRDLGRNRITVGNYIQYLRYGLLICEVSNLRSNLLVSSRKGRKIYPANPAFCFAYTPDFFTDRVLEKIAEVSACAHLGAPDYYQNSFEVDFVLKSPGLLLPIEVKWGAWDERQVRHFMKKFNAASGLIVTREDERELREGLEVIPHWRWLLHNPTKLHL